MFTKNDRDILTPLLDDKLLGSNRQSLPEIYIPNGAVYVTKACFLIENESLYSKQTVGYVMPKERSIDIDTEFDFVLLETLISHYKI